MSESEQLPVRPALGGAIERDDVLLVREYGADSVVLVHEVKNGVVLGWRVYGGRAIEWHSRINSASMGVLRRGGGMAWFIAESVAMGEAFALETIAGEQQELLRILDLPPFGVQSVDAFLKERAITLIRDPKQRLRLELLRAVRSGRNVQPDDRARIAMVDSVDLLREALAEVSIDRYSQMLTELLRRFAEIDPGALVAWVAERDERAQAESVTDFMSEDFPFASTFDHYMRSASLSARCQVAAFGRLHDAGPGHWVCVEACAPDGDPYLALFLALIAAREGFSLAAGLMERALEGLRLLELGERPDVPWALAVPGDDAEGIDDAWCGRRRGDLEGERRNAAK